MKSSNINLILIGGGGFALEIYSYISDERQRNNLKNVHIKGVLDSSPNCELCTKNTDVEYLGDIPSYNVQEEDFGLIAVANASSRKMIFALIKKISLPLFTYIHSTACVALNASLGDGVFIGPHSIISAHSSIADNVALNVFCGVGHGAKIGENSVMSPYSVVNGDCELGETVFLGSRVTLNPKVKIGDFSLIDSGSIIREDIPAFSIVSQRVVQKIYDNRILRQKFSGH